MSPRQLVFKITPTAAAGEVEDMRAWPIGFGPDEAALPETFIFDGLSAGCFF